MQVILIWNDLEGDVPKDITTALPKEKLFIVRPEKNSLQNRYLPMDIIRTDAILNLDDDVRISNSDYASGFRQDKVNYLLSNFFEFFNLGHGKLTQQSYWDL